MMGIRRKTAVGALLTVCVAAGLSACGDGGGGESGDSDAIRIGYLSSENDPAADYPEGRIAAEAAVKYINDELDGLEGRKLELVPCIVTSAPEPSQACANKMVQEDVVAVINPYNYSEAVEYPIFKAAGLASFGGGVGGGTGSGFAADTNVTWAAGPFQLNAGTADFAVEKLGAKKAAIVYLNVSSFDTVIKGLESGLKEKGVELEKVGAAPATSDWIPPLQAALDTDPDVLIVYQAQAGCLGLAKAYQQLKSDVPVVTQTLCGDSSVLDAAGDAAENWYFVNAGPWPENADEDPEVKIYNDALTAYADGDAVNPGGAAPLGFSNVMTLYEDVMKPLGPDSITSEKLLEQAKKITEGTAFMGSPLFKCGTHSVIPSSCGGAGERVYQLKGGVFTPADGGEFIGTDLAAYGADG